MTGSRDKQSSKDGGTRGPSSKDKKENSGVVAEDFIQVERRKRKDKAGGDGRKSRERSAADLIRAHSTALKELNNELRMEAELGEKPDLWMIAFDNPLEFIQFCRKRLDNERELLERSRQTENDIINLLKRWTDDTDKLASVLGDLCTVQNHNDKLQEAISEERTNCQHLVGSNYVLESEIKLLTRKYHAALMLGKVEDRSVKHLLERNPKAVALTDKMCDLNEKIKKCDPKLKGAGDCADPYVLAEKVEKLEKYIENLKKQHREEVNCLKDSIGKYDMKYDALKLHYKDALQRNTDAFEEVRELLSVSVRENLELREEILKRDDKFLQTEVKEIKKFNCKHQRHHLRRKTEGIDTETPRLHDCCYDEERMDEKAERELKLKVSRLEIEVEEKSKLLKDVLNKLMVFERTCARLKEENAAMKASHQHSLNAVREKNEILRKRCEKTDERRKLDNEGFREDVRELRCLLKTLGKNVSKCIRLYGDLEAETDIHPGISEEEFQAIVDTQKGVDREKKAWLLKTDPKLVQKGMIGWTDFLENKLDRLEDMLQISKYKQGVQERD